MKFTNRGIREPVPSSGGTFRRADHDIYFRTFPTIDVPPGAHDWLSRSIFIGMGHHTDGGNRIDYFEVTD